MTGEPIIGDVDWRWQACETCKYNDKKNGGCLAPENMKAFEAAARISRDGGHVVCGLYEADGEASKE